MAMNVSYSVLPTYIEHIKAAALLDDTQRTAPACVAVLVAGDSSGTSGQQVPLQVLIQSCLLLRGPDYFSLLTTEANGQHNLYSLIHAVQQQQHRQGSQQPAETVVFRKRLSLPEGPSQQLGNRWSNLSITARCPADDTSSSQHTWQLQHEALIPPCRGLQQFPGSVTACCLITHSAEHQQQHPNHQQNILRQSLGVSPAANSSSNNQQLLARLAAVAAAAVSPTHHHRTAATCSSLVCCKDDLCAAAEAAVQGSCPASSSSSSSSRSSLESVYFLVGSSSGEVWLTDARYAMQSSSSNSNSSSHDNVAAAAGAGGEQRHREQQQQQCQPPRLLVDLQQPIVALLPVPVVPADNNGHSSKDSASAILVVGALGRVGLLHLQQQQQQQHDDSAKEQADAAATEVQWCMTTQQLPFQVQAAGLWWDNDAQPQQQEQQQQQQQRGCALVLLSSSGLLYLADLTAAAAVSHCADDQKTTSSSSSSRRSRLSLQPVQLQLPGRVSKMWLCSHLQQQSSSSSSSRCNSLVLQLQNSSHLIKLKRNLFNLLQQQQQQRTEQQEVPIARAATTSLPTTSSSAVAAAAAAAAVRQQVEGAMSALEILSAARKNLEQAIIEQDRYLSAVGQDLAVLRLFNPLPLQQMMTSTTAAAAASDTTKAAAAAAAALHCRIQLQGLWPAPAAAAAPGSSSMHLAVSIQLESSSSSSSSRGAVELCAGWQLVVSFLGESSQCPSCQTTVPIAASSSSSSSNSSRGWSVSLLLPLPSSCMQLSEGGWLQVYAAKEPPSTLVHAAAAAANSMDSYPLNQHLQQQQQQQQQNASQTSEVVPAVALLGQHYISVLQLSSLLAANPAAAATATVLQPLRFARTAAADAAAKQGSHESSYTCMMQLQTVKVINAIRTNTTELDIVHGQQQRQPAEQYRSHKRPRAEQQATAAAEAMQQVQQQPGTGDLQQQQQKGAHLGKWLEEVAFASQQQQQGVLGSISQHQYNSSRFSLYTAGVDIAVPLMQGQVCFKLCYNAHGQLTWASRPLLPQRQRQQQQQQQQERSSVTPSAAAAAAGGVEQLHRLPMQVAMQATSVSGLAQMHRSFMLALLRQLDTAATSSAAATAGRHVSWSENYAVGSSGSSSVCRIVTQKQQLQVALHQLQVLHQQLMQLRDVAEIAGSKREQLVSLLQTTAAYGKTTRASLQQQQEGKDSQTGSVAEVFGELVKVLGTWESGVDAAYGRFLLAVSAAAAFEFLEV